MLLPHPRYLIDYAPLSASFAAALMCSGLTAYAAFRRFAAYPEHVKQGPLLLVGMGGVGMMGLAIACRMFPHAPIVADIDPRKREAALAAGAQAAFDPADAGARKAILARTGGGVLAAVRFRRLRPLAHVRDRRDRQGRPRGGDRTVRRHVHDAGRDVRPQGDGDRRHADRHARGSARTGRARAHLEAQPPPMSERPLADAQAVLDELRAGRVVGRVVLTA